MKLIKENIDFKRGQNSKKSLGVGANTPESVHKMMTGLADFFDENLPDIKVWLHGADNQEKNIGGIEVMINTSRFNLGYEISEDPNDYSGWYLWDGSEYLAQSPDDPSVVIKELTKYIKKETIKELVKAKEHLEILETKHKDLITLENKYAS